MIHLLLLSREGRWARDPQGNQWILRPLRDGDANFCHECPGTTTRLTPGQSAWIARLPWTGAMHYDKVACQACVDVQHPLHKETA